MASPDDPARGSLTRIGKEYVGYLVGYLVALPACAAAVLGKVPGVDVPLNLFPPGSRATVTVVSSIIVGTVPAVIHFWSKEIVARSLIRKLFGYACAWLATSLVLLFVLASFFIEEVPILRGKSSANVIVGSHRIEGPPCDCAPTDGPMSCIQKLGIGNEAALETCWDAASIKRRRIVVQASCILVMAGLSGLMGLLVLQTRGRGRRRRPVRRAAAPPGT
jgi:hypothetical protein